MSQAGYDGSSGWGGLGGMSAPQGTERGARRKKIAGYLKAANELRQAHFGNRDGDERDELPAIPGSFPDVAIATHGDEQLVLFPS